MNKKITAICMSLLIGATTIGVSSVTANAKPVDTNELSKVLYSNVKLCGIGGVEYYETGYKIVNSGSTYKTVQLYSRPVFENGERGLWKALGGSFITTQQEINGNGWIYIQ